MDINKKYEVQNLVFILVIFYNAFAETSTFKILKDGLKMIDS